MASVTHTVTLPDGSTPRSVGVSIRLLATDGTGVGPAYVTATGEAIEGDLDFSASTGTWSKDLEPNANITPAGTVWRVIERIGGKSYTWTVLVTGPGDLSRMLVDPPGVIQPAASTTYTDTSIANAVPVRTSAAALLLKKLAVGAQDTGILMLGDSTGDEPTEWPALTFQALAAAWPGVTFQRATWNDTTRSYDAPTTVTTGTGPRICTLWSGSVAGWGTQQFLGDRWPAIAGDVAPADIAILNLGHNEVFATTDQWDRYATLVETLRQAHPGVPIIAALQNYRTDGQTDTLYPIYQAIAAERGLQLFDIGAAVATAIGPPATATVDGIHPTSAAHAYIATQAVRLFGNYPRVTPPFSPPSLLNEATQSEFVADGNLLDSTLPGWVRSGVDVSIDSALSDGITGRSIRLQSQAAQAQSLITYTAPAGVAASVRGEWVTLAVRMWRPANTRASHGRVQVGDNVTSTTTSGQSDPNNAWHWQVISHKIDPAATTLTFRVYVDSDNTSDGDIRIDRVVATRGRLPRGLLPATGLSQKDAYTAAGTYTWTKPAWAQTVALTVVGAGAGGGSGRVGAAGTARAGGGSGGAGAWARTDLTAAELPATLTVTVGAGGTGGAAVATADTDGQAGGDGAESNVTGSGFTMRAMGGNQGGGGNASFGSAGNPAGFSTYSGGAAGRESVPGPVDGGLIGGAGGSSGGAGGGISTSDAAANGGGGAQGGNSRAAGVFGGTAPGGNGDAGAGAEPSTLGFGGGGGGGGAASTTGDAGSGGGGGYPGGSGGGGGAAQNGHSSGAGGTGADGLVIILSKS